MPIDDTTPADDSAIAAFPANERSHRSLLKTLVETEHDDTTGNHKIPVVADATARDVAFPSPAAGNLCYRQDTDALELYDGAWKVVVLTVDPTGVTAHSTTDGDQAADQAPGISGAQVNGVDLEDDLEQLRYAIRRMAVGIGTTRNAGVGEVEWFDKPAFGQNLVQNGRFAAWGGASATAPLAWTKVLTPPVCQVDSRSTAEGQGRELQIQSNATGQGVEQSISGLRANTLYYLRVRCRCVSGSFQISTTGGSGAVFGNFLETVTSASNIEVTGVILTDATPTAIVIRLLSLGGSDVFFVSEVDLLAMGPAADDGVPRAANELPEQWTRTATKAALQTVTVGGSWTTLTSLTDLAVFVPGPGYQILVTAVVPATSNAGGSRSAFAIKLRQDFNDGGYGDLSGTIAIATSNQADQPQTIVTQAVIDNPTPGKYEFEVQLRCLNSDCDVAPNHATFGQTTARLTAQLVKRL